MALLRLLKMLITIAARGGIGSLDSVNSQMFCFSIATADIAMRAAREAATGLSGAEVNREAGGMKLRVRRYDWRGMSARRRKAKRAVPMGVEMLEAPRVTRSLLLGLYPSEG